MENQNKDEIENKETIENIEETGLQLDYGDIVQIEAPSNSDIHDMTAFIDYIDNTQIMLIDTNTSQKHNLQIKEDGTFHDESIISIYLLDKSDERGFAKQNGLLVNKWVNLRFGGEIPQLVTGQITNLEEDMIEITTWPELNVLYINFAYKGIPLHIPLEEIVLRDKPLQLENITSLSNLKSSEESLEEETDETNLASIEYTETGESVVQIPEDVVMDENVEQKLQELYVDVNSIQFGEKLEKIAQVVEIPENEQRYGIETQVNDMMDELLSSIPNHNRTKDVLQNIHLLITRFKELRHEFSLFDKNNSIYDVKKFTAFYKPLVDKLHNIETNLKWIVPIVKNRKRIYINDEDKIGDINNEDVVLEKMSEIVTSIEEKQNNYYKNSKANVQYEDYEKEMNELIMPIEEPLEKEDCLIVDNVLTDIDAVVENLEDFQSSVFTESEKKQGINKQKFLIQRYNIGTEKLGEQVLKNGKSIFKREQLTESDKICIKSLVMLPQQVIQFSKIDLHKTNLLEKANLHLHYISISQLMRSNKEIVPHVINDLSKEFSYFEEKETEKDKNIPLEEGEVEEEKEKENETDNNKMVKEDFFKMAHQFLLDENINMISDNKYKDFLEAVIPKTKTIIQLIRNYLKDKVSFYHVINQLEPFMIYSHNISYKQYLFIRRHIIEKIKELKILNENKNADLSFLNNANYSINKKPQMLMSLLAEKQESDHMILELYKLKENMSTQEMLKNIYDLDNGNFYFEVLQSIMYSLLNPENLIESLTTIEDVTDIEKIKPEVCGTRYLAKKYKSIEEMQKDNKEDSIYFDIEYDDTPYVLFEKYKAEQQNMENDLFTNFLIENLVAKHDCPPEQAPQMAKNLISGKKEVENGHYAIVEIYPKLVDNIDKGKLTEKEILEIEIENEVRKRTTYYKRINNNWVQDSSLDVESFVDNNELFCNISENCFKNTKTTVCEDKNITQKRMQEINKNKLLNEFDSRFTMTMQELEEKIEKYIDFYGKTIKKIYKNRMIHDYKLNNLSYQIGSYANKEELILSPHLQLRENILSIQDYSKKQFYICQYAEYFCRDPLVENLHESPNWLYCIKTNTKLLPMSLLELAKAFVEQNDFLSKLEIIIRKYGTLSDDGDSIVDKYSGYILQKRDFVEEEKYDAEGRKQTSHDILEEDLGIVTEQKLMSQEKVFENEVNEMIHNILKALCTNIGIKLEDVEDFIKPLTISICENNKVIYTEQEYERKSELQKKKNKKPLGPYSVYRNERRIYIAASLLLIAIQTNIPSFQTKKTFPGCVKSFEGFPQTGVENMNGLTYLSCVLYHIKSKIAPWNSLEKLNVEKIKSRMKEMIEKHILVLNDITERYSKKSEFLLLYPDETIPEELNVNKWKQYLPPFQKTHISENLQNISTDFEKQLIHTIKKGDSKQTKMMHTLINKNKLFTLLLIEKINEIVNSKNPLLKTLSEIAFLENACCNESLEDIHPMLYFIKEEPLLRSYLENILSNNKIINKMRGLGKASINYFNVETKLIYPSLPSGFLEKDVYEVIIHYCNLNKSYPIPEELKEFLSEKPSFYNSSLSLDENMIEFKRNGKKFKMSDLQKVLNIVNRKNLVYTKPYKNYSKIDSFKDVLVYLQEKDETIIKEPCVTHLQNILKKYDAKKMYSNNSEEVNTLYDYLVLSNKNLKDVINHFIKANGNLNPAEFKKIDAFLISIHKWDVDKKTNLVSMHNYFETLFQHMCCIYPNMLLNNSNFEINIHKHLNISDEHMKHLYKYLDKHYSGLEKFKDDEIINRILSIVTPELKDMYKFVKNIPVFEFIEKEENIFYSFIDKETLYQLYLYCFYSMMEYYIQIIDDEDLVVQHVYIHKSNKRKQIEESKDPSNYIVSSNNNIDENNVDRIGLLDEVQIYTGQKEELSKKIASLLLSFLEIEKTNKETINYNYKDIMKKVSRSREREKQNMIKNLEQLSIEERKIEDKFKAYRLEKWNVGQQKGLIQYDANVYEREMNELIAQISNEMGDNNLDPSNYEAYESMGISIEDLERMQQQNQIQETSEETNNIADLGEHFMDGQYYEDEIENDLE